MHSGVIWHLYRLVRIGDEDNTEEKFYSVADADCISCSRMNRGVGEKEEHAELILS